MGEKKIKKFEPKFFVLESLPKIQKKSKPRPLNKHSSKKNSLNSDLSNINLIDRNALNSKEMIVKIGKKSKSVYNTFNLPIKNKFDPKKSGIGGKPKKTKLTRMKKIIINERLTTFIQQTILEPIICK